MGKWLDFFNAIGKLIDFFDVTAAQPIHFCDNFENKSIGAHSYKSRVW